MIALGDSAGWVAISRPIIRLADDSSEIEQVAQQRIPPVGRFFMQAPGNSRGISGMVNWARRRLCPAISKWL